MLDNSLVINTSTPDIDDVVLIIPEGVEPPADFPLKKKDWSWDSLSTVINDKLFPIVLEVAPEYISFVEQAGNLTNFVIKTLRGFQGDYPSYWLMSAAKYPQVGASEIMIAAEDSTAAGGDGVPAKAKRKESDFKPIDPRQAETQRDLAQENWNDELDDEPV